MRKQIIYCLIGILACTYVSAQSYCHLVKPVGTSYTDTITEPGTYYYSAWTFDLPMDVYFITTNPACTEPPQVWSDLTCVPGQYDDPNIRELIQDTAKYGISVPMKLKCETSWVDSLGGYVHHIKLGKSYRNKLKLVGVDYNVQAYVKVVLPCGGIAIMEQDTSSQACINDARRVSIQDETRVLANDSLSTYIFSYKDWLAQADSVALHWEGPDSVTVWVEGNNCEFSPDVLHAWDFYEIPPYGEYHLSSSKMEDALNSGTQDTTGYFFAKIFSTEEGYLSTRPLVPETKGATLLHYDSTQVVHVADENAFFCFPTNWESVEWIAQTRKIVKMYLHSSPDLAPVDSFKFDLQDSTRRVLQWSKSEINLIRKNASSPLLFIRFDCSREEFKITPYNLSAASSCVGSSVRLSPGRNGVIGRSHILRLPYEYIEGYPLQISCVNTNPNDRQNLFIADTCEFTLRWNTNATKKRCVLYKQTAYGGETWTIDSATVASWKSRVTPDGYLYVRGTADGIITLTTDKPEEQDPEGDDPDDEDPGIPTAVMYTRPETECTKFLHNGQIVILRAGKAYTVTGQMIKMD